MKPAASDPGSAYFPQKRVVLIEGRADLIKQYLPYLQRHREFFNEQLNQVQTLYIAETEYLTERSRLPILKLTVCCCR